MIKINKNKVIGEVIFVVEGRVDEANIIRDIFINLLGYKESPIDRGPEVFMQMFNERVVIN